MENLFENTYVRDRKIMKEVYQYFYFKSPLYLLIDTIIGLIFVANIALWLSGKGQMNYAVLIAVPLFLLIRYCVYQSALTSLEKQDAELYRGKPVKVQNFVTEKGLKMVIYKNVNEMPYEQIKSVIKTKKVIIISSAANTMYVFDKKSFTVGTAEEFLAFLKGKGIKVQMSL